MFQQPQAKINLGLYVTERRPDGYHNLQTCFYPIPLTDNLEIKELRNSNEPWSLQVAGNAVEGDAKDNLVVRAYESLREEFASLPPVDIYLYKRIPTGAGLGGGSSDAAAALCMLNDMFALGLSADELERRAARLGADCAFFVRSRPAMAEGIGDILTPFDVSLRGWEMVLVKPHDFVSTREAYAHVRPRPVLRGDAERMPIADVLRRHVEEWRGRLSNDFEDSVFLSHPRIAAIKETLYDMGAAYASMSGSGAAVFGLFRHRPESAEEVFKDCFLHQARLLK